MKQNDDITCKIVKSIAKITENARTSMQLNLVSWNGRPAKYDLRTWGMDGKAYKCIYDFLIVCRIQTGHHCKFSYIWLAADYPPLLHT